MTGIYRRCRACTLEAWKIFRLVWANTHPLSYAARLEAVSILQPLAEVQVSDNAYPPLLLYHLMKNPYAG